MKKPENTPLVWGPPEVKKNGKHTLDPKHRHISRAQWEEWEEQADREQIETRKPVIGIVFLLAIMVLLITICVLIFTNLK